LKQALDPNALSAQQLIFHIKAKRHDKFAALFVDLEGTLDRLNALELIKRIKEAANQASMDIIVNFEHLKLATPDALKALVASDAMKLAIPNVQGFPLAGIEHLNEDLQDA
jgi:U3 small nucleolar ribonucleoprotein component